MKNHQTHIKLPSRQKTKRQIFIDNTETKNNIDKVEESKAKARFIPKLPENPNYFAGAGLKFGGPLYIPSNKDYGNHRAVSRGRNQSVTKDEQQQASPYQNNILP
jgi:hypothetical protein